MKDALQAKQPETLPDSSSEESISSASSERKKLADRDRRRGFRSVNVH